MTRADFLRWLLELIKATPLPVSTATLIPEDSEFDEAIEVVVGAQTFWIAVQEPEVG